MGQQRVQAAGTGGKMTVGQRVWAMVEERGEHSSKGAEGCSRQCGSRDRVR